MLPDPWKRAKPPAVLPTFRGVEDLRAISREDLAPILRDHLEPSSTVTGYANQWRSFWSLMAFDEDLADTAGEIIEEFANQTQAAIDSGQLDDAQRKRAVRFHERCLKALDRLDRAEEDPLGWAGARAAVFNPRARPVLAALIDAIDTHRRQTGTGSPADEQLWGTLRRLGFDPEDY